MVLLLSAEVCSPEDSTVLTIPSMSYDGIQPLPLIGLTAEASTGIAAAIDNAGANTATSQAFVSQHCGGLFGAWGTHTYHPTAVALFGREHAASTASTIAQCLVCKCITCGFQLVAIASCKSPLHSAARVQPFTVGVTYSDTSTAGSKWDGFKLEYSQVRSQLIRA